MAGPPHSIIAEEVNRHYQDSYCLTLAEKKEMPNGLKGNCAATKNVWLLQKD
jgi:thiopurine S-methyltransferase